MYGVWCDGGVCQVGVYGVLGGILGVSGGGHVTYTARTLARPLGGLGGGWWVLGGGEKGGISGTCTRVVLLESGRVYRLSASFTWFRVV